MTTISFKVPQTVDVNKILGILKVFGVQNIEQKEDSDVASDFVLTDKHLKISEEREKRGEYRDAEEVLNELNLKYEL